MENKKNGTTKCTSYNYFGELIINDGNLLPHLKEKEIKTENIIKTILSMSYSVK